MTVDLDELVERLRAVDGVVAVTLGGSRATGDERADSDWDIGVYYEDRLDTNAIRAWGWKGQVFEPGDWAEFMHGGAWLRHRGERIDLIYRNIATVDHWIDEAEAGRFELRRVPGYLAGMPSYVLAAELALGRRLTGRVPVPDYPAALAEQAPARWRWEAEFALTHAAAHLERGDEAIARGFVGLALLQLGHARLAEARRWVRNEKGLVGASGLATAQQRFDLIDEQHGLPAALAWLRDSAG